MPLEEAVYRLTCKTALMHDITDRGFIAAGKVADITIFDPDTITEKPREPVAALPAGGVQVQREAVGSKGVSTRCAKRGAVMVTPVFVAPLCGGAGRRRTRQVRTEQQEREPGSGTEVLLPVVTVASTRTSNPCVVPTESILSIPSIRLL